MGCPVRSWKVVSLLTALSLLPFAGALPAQSAPVSEGSLTLPGPAFEKELAHVRKLLRDAAKTRKAAAAVPKLRELAGDRCGYCLLEIAQVERLVGESDQALATTRAALALHGRREFEAKVYNQLGALLVSGSGSEPRQAEAEGYLRQAIELGDPMALFNLAVLQWRRVRSDETLAFARRYLASDPRGKATEPAHILVCHARAALEGGAPPASGSPAVTIQRGSGITPPKNLYRELLSSAPPGKVALDAVIDEEGCVVETKLSKGSKSPELEELARKAARYWVFQPAMYQGHPIRVSYRLVVDSRRAPQYSYNYSNNSTTDTSQYFRTFDVRDFADIKSDRDGTYSPSSRWP